MVRKIKDINQAKLLLKDMKEMLKEEEKSYDNCNDSELKELYLSNINDLNIRIGQLSVQIQQFECSYFEDDEVINNSYSKVKEDDFPSFYYKDEL